MHAVMVLQGFIDEVGQCKSGRPVTIQDLQETERNIMSAITILATQLQTSLTTISGQIDQIASGGVSSPADVTAIQGVVTALAAVETKITALLTPATGTPTATLDAIANVSIAASSPAQTVALTGIGSTLTQSPLSLTVTVASSNPALIPTPVVTYTSPNATGSLVFTPVPAAVGTATVTVTVSDASATPLVKTFVITVA